MTSEPKSTRFRDSAPRAALALAALALALLALAPAASASKQAVDFFGGSGALGGQFNSPNGVAVNDSGAGPANVGDVYAIDSGSPSASGNRIQRFGRDDNGTPGNTPAAAADDTYFFISAWGADVVQDGGTGDLGDAAAANYEICTVAAECQAAAPSGGNGTAAGNGALDFTAFFAGSIAVDQDTGNLFVTDSDNNRVNVYDGAGTFLRSFGFDVAASGPGNTGTGYEVCVAADGDVCKAGASGANLGQIGAGARGIAVSAPDGNPSTGTVFLADSANNRVDTYSLDGSSPGSIGSAAEFASGHPNQVAVDSRGILYAGNFTPAPAFRDFEWPVERYDTADANGGGVGFLAPLEQGEDERQQLTVAATAGTFNLTFDGDTTADLPFDATAAQLEAALEALASVPPGALLISGGPGDAGGTQPYTIAPNQFESLGAADLPQITCADGATPLSGGAGCSATTTSPGEDGLLYSSRRNLAVDPDSDGGGPDADVLYAVADGPIQQFGPANSPGLTVPPALDDDRHATNGTFSSPATLAVEPATGRLYAAASGSAGPGVYVIDETGPPPTASMDSVDNVTIDSADLHATIDPNGPPLLSYRFEHSDDGGSTWTPTPTVVLGIQTDPQDIDTTLEPAPIGLSPNADYLVRLVATRRFATPIVTAALPFRTDPSPPLAETAGAPVRSTTSAQLNGRLVPRNNPTTFHFEYGDLGPCDANPCASTPSTAAGSDDIAKLVAAQLRDLTPDTTYHYRLIADNGIGSPAAGVDMTVHTRATDVFPNQSDQFPGPPGSDRAWEMVSMAETSGNPLSLFATNAFSDDGNRAIYGIAGGTPIGPGGTFSSIYMSQRTASGWQPSLVFPEREELIESGWTSLHTADDLSSLAATNQRDGGGGRGMQIWRLHPDAAPSLLFERRTVGESPIATSADGSRVLAQLIGAPLDPAYPAAATRQNIYDVSSASPRLASLLPGNLIGPCGSLRPAQDESNPVSADGTLAYFEARPTAPCEGIGASAAQLYVRDLIAAQSRLISGPALSGPDCGASLIAATPDAAFFVTCSRLDPVDGGGNDVYRYQLSDGSLDCVTCVIAGFDVNVEGSNAVAVAEDGSRLYFTTTKRLLPGAPPDGERGIYRVEVATGALAYVAPIAGGNNNIGVAFGTTELDADGQVFAFSSDLGFLNPLGGTADNGAATQYYRYDDADRSLICASCPQDGSAPLGELATAMHRTPDGGHNQRLLSADGDTLAFSTPTPLAGADQNTPDTDPVAGTDAYEWRDGRQILVSDGLTNWPTAPNVVGISPSGADIYFAAPAAYTPDAPDALIRLYDARIGGGIAFPVPPPPCPLEVCQGTPRGAPERPFVESRSTSGPGNLTQPISNRRVCPKGKRKVRRKGKVRCVPKRAQHKPLRCPKGKRKVRRGGVVRCVKRPRHQRQANHDRRATR